MNAISAVVAPIRASDGDQAGRRRDGEGRQVTMTGFLHEKELSRKNFLKGSGAVVVGASVVGEVWRARPSAGSQADPAGYKPTRRRSIVAGGQRRQHDSSSGRRRWRRGTASRPASSRLLPRSSTTDNHTDAVRPLAVRRRGALTPASTPGTPSTPAARAARTRCPAPAADPRGCRCGARLHASTGSRSWGCVSQLSVDKGVVPRAAARRYVRLR